MTMRFATRFQNDSSCCFTSAYQIEWSISIIFRRGSHDWPYILCRVGPCPLLLARIAALALFAKKFAALHCMSGGSVTIIVRDILSNQRSGSSHCVDNDTSVEYQKDIAKLACVLYNFVVRSTQLLSSGSSFSGELRKRGRSFRSYSGIIETSSRRTG